ncbi:bone morphogenetic protein 7-like [Amphibalanus amphitrite]|uniref:bone morphogenetic protein 7-like n=1 Tax=Amphibalanus amphitrite TaxID=1232801 RepID=UPI001C8FA925|nr:bone morphogenetic protein 7-like [Amphibalanus amphitrite]
MRPRWLWLLCALWGAVCPEHSPIYVDNHKGQTVAGEEISDVDRAEIQEDLLLLLGLHRRPRPAFQEVQSSAPQFLMDIYNSMVDDEDTGDLKLDPEGVGSAWKDFNITTVDKQVIDESDLIMSFINHGSKLFKELELPRSQLLWFDLTEVPMDENQLDTSLRVYQGYAEDALFDYQSVTLRIFQLIGGEGETRPDDIQLKEVGARVLEPGYVGWLTFNVSSAADLWRMFPHSNLGLFMEVTSEGGEQLVPGQVGLVDAYGEQARQPFMTAFFKQQQLKRPLPRLSRFKRSPNGKRGKKKRNRSNSQTSSSSLKDYIQKQEFSVCQKRNLYVSFRDLGWQDWIIAPDGYAAFFCMGICSFPINSQMNATNHAIVQTLTHLLEPFLYPKPSCAPTKLNSISVLYFDDKQNVNLRKYSKMVATSCGCH